MGNTHMGIFDKAKDALSEHSDKVDPVIDKAGDAVDSKTGGKYVGQVDKGQELAKERLAAEQGGEVPPPA